MKNKICTECDGVYLGYCETCLLRKEGDDMKFSYLKLRGRIIERFRTIEAFAAEIDRSKVSVSRKLNCKSSFSQGDILLWARALEIQESEIGDYFFS